MRRLITGLCATTAFFLLLAAPPVEARGRQAAEPVEAIQPTDSNQLVLLSRSGWARVEAHGSRRAVSLRAQERLSAIAETTAGWVAGGVDHDDDRASIFFVEERSGVTDRLPAVPQRASLQLLPVLLTHDGNLQGAAWLEGNGYRSLAVRYADWTGIAWGPVVTISAPGPGSQTGLTGLALAGGELLLSWSRFDGTDDDLYWSWREGSHWSRPKRVGPNNRTPDMAPALARTGRGATLVWNRLDQGEYRLLSRRFDSESWGSERLLGGPGSLFPSLIRTDDRLLVLYRTAVPKGWSLTELDHRARLRRRAFARVARDTRPLVVERANGPVLEWRQPNRSSVLQWDFQAE